MSVHFYLIVNTYYRNRTLPDFQVTRCGDFVPFCNMCWPLCIRYVITTFADSVTILVILIQHVDIHFLSMVGTSEVEINNCVVTSIKRKAFDIGVDFIRPPTPLLSVSFVLRRITVIFTMFVFTMFAWFSPTYLSLSTLRSCLYHMITLFMLISSLLKIYNYFKIANFIAYTGLLLTNYLTFLLASIFGWDFYVTIISVYLKLLLSW